MGNKLPGNASTKIGLFSASHVHLLEGGWGEHLENHEGPGIGSCHTNAIPYESIVGV